LHPDDSQFPSSHRSLDLRNGFSAQASLVGVYDMSIHMHIIQRNYLATSDLRAQAQATTHLHLVKGTEPVDWRRLEVSIGVSYDAQEYSPRLGQSMRRPDYLSFPALRRMTE
jgi:hypothetical protein